MQIKQISEVAFRLVQPWQMREQMQLQTIHLLSMMQPPKLLYVQLDIPVIHRALNALVRVNSKLGRQNPHCKQLQCVVACYLVSMLLLKCVADLIISALFSIIHILFHNNIYYQKSQNYSHIIPASFHPCVLCFAQAACVYPWLI